jgi:uncharacterized protein (DUF302 family)
MKMNWTRFVAVVLLTFGITANGAQDIRIYTADNQGGKINPAGVEKAFADAGFYVTGINNMNIPFDAKYKKHPHELYYLMTVHKKDFVNKIAKKYPEIALFTPLSMSIFTRNGDKTLSISSMSANGIAKITGIPSDNADLAAYMKDVADTLAKALPHGKFENLSYQIGKPEGDLVTRFTMEMDVKDDEIEDEAEGIQEELEAGLETGGFVVAGFNHLAPEFANAGNDTYDFFDVYSICKVPVIYTVSRTHPEAGAFAPCTLYMYKKKGETVVHFAYPSIYNWISSIDVLDKESKEVLLNAQNLMNNTLAEVTE